MGIQRQVVGQQIDVMGQQQSQALLHPARDPTILPAPKQAVMNQNRIGTPTHGGLDQGQAGGHPRDDFLDLGPPLDLKAVGPVVPEALGLKHLVKPSEQDRSVDRSNGIWTPVRGGRRIHARIIPPEQGSYTPGLWLENGSAAINF